MNLNRNYPMYPETLQPCDFYPKYCCSACTHFKKCAPKPRTLGNAAPAHRRKSRLYRKCRTGTDSGAGLCVITPVSQIRSQSRCGREG